MKQLLSWKKLPLLVLALGLVLTVTFAQSNSGRQPRTGTDTIPAKQKKIRNLDEALAEIDRSEMEVERAMREIDHERIEREVREAMKNVDIDMAKMKEDVAKAMKEIDMQKISLDVQKAMKEIDSEKIKAEVAEALSKVDMEKVKAEMEKVKSIDLKNMKEELAAIKPEIEKAMKDAKEGIEKARKEITTYKNLVNALEKDGLLKEDGNFRIDYKNKELTVNGKKLSVEETKPYRQYLDGKKDFTIEKDEDNFRINN